jgi:hypothetical protein
MNTPRTEEERSLALTRVKAETLLTALNLYFDEFYSSRRLFNLKPAKELVVELVKLFHPKDKKGEHWIKELLELEVVGALYKVRTKPSHPGAAGKQVTGIV